MNIAGFREAARRRTSPSRRDFARIADAKPIASQTKGNCFVTKRGEAPRDAARTRRSAQRRPAVSLRRKRSNSLLNSASTQWNAERRELSSGERIVIGPLHPALRFQKGPKPRRIGAQDLFGRRRIHVSPGIGDHSSRRRMEPKLGVGLHASTPVGQPERAAAHTIARDDVHAGSLADISPVSRNFSAAIEMTSRKIGEEPGEFFRMDRRRGDRHYREYARGYCGKYSARGEKVPETRNNAH